MEYDLSILAFSENCQYKFKPNIDLTENLGNEKIAYIKIDGNEISAKIPSQNKIIDQIGFDIKISLFLMKLVLE